MLLSDRTKLEEVFNPLLKDYICISETANDINIYIYIYIGQRAGTSKEH